ncbi:MAG: hypothetical protein WD226_11450 [Planctomycetota bacterium]
MSTTQRRRRTPEEKIRDLQAEIARLESAKLAKKSPARKQARASKRSLEKALALAQDENDRELERALTKAIDSLTATVEGGGGSGARRARRTPEEAEALADQMVEFLRANPQSTIGAVADSVGETSKDLREPMLQLLEERRVKKTGQRRGTRYSAK